MAAPGLGGFLEWLRRRAGFSLREAGAKSAIDFTSIGRFETGERDPAPQQLISLAGAYGVNRHFVLMRAGFLPLPGFDALLGDQEESEALDDLLHAATLGEKRELVKYLAALRVTSPLVEELYARHAAAHPPASGASETRG